MFPIILTTANRAAYVFKHFDEHSLCDHYSVAVYSKTGRCLDVFRLDHMPPVKNYSALINYAQQHHKKIDYI